MKRSITLFLSTLFFFTLFFACKNTPSNTQQGSLLPRGKVLHIDRFEQEIQNFEAADSKEMPAAGSLLFIGSSSIRLWSSLTDDFAPMSVINRGFGGSTIEEVNHYADRIVHKYNPSVIVIYCGENDLTEGRSPALVFQDFKKFIGETEKNLGKVPVAYISAKPSPARWEHWRKFETLNRMVEQFAKGRPNLRFINISQSLMSDTGEPDSTLFVEDQLHMNSGGYANWTDVVRPVVEGLYEKKKDI